MKRSHIFSLVTVFCFLLIGAGDSGRAHADDSVIRIASGRKGFTYRAVYARNLEKLMPGYKFAYLPSEGSGQNLDLLAMGKADVAFAQADVFAVKQSQEAERYRDILPVGRIAPECVYIARRAQDPKATLEELAGKATEAYAVIAIGNYDSGMLWSWAYIQSLIVGLDRVRASTESGTLALNHLALGSLDAVGWVSDPNNRDHKMLRAVHANEAIELMPLNNPALTEARSDGSPVYEARTVMGGPGGKGPKIQTICTQAVLFTRKGVPESLVEKLSDLVSLKRDQIAPSDAR